MKKFYPAFRIAWIPLGLAIAIFLAIGNAASARAQEAAVQTAAPEHDIHSILVRFSPGTSKTFKDYIADCLKDHLGQDVTYKDDDGDGIDDRFCYIEEGRWVQYDFPLTRSADDAALAKELLTDMRSSAIEVVEFNLAVHIDAAASTPNDPMFQDQWALHNNRPNESTYLPDADIDAPEAWETTKGSREIVVAVIDTGLSQGHTYIHSDLLPNLWTNPGEVLDGKDNDGNGWIDDLHGYNFNTEDPKEKGNVYDEAGHGTHVAGIIGATGNNGKGIAGVCWEVTLLPMKATTLKPFHSIVVQCINMVINLRNKGVNIRVINCSWGFDALSESDLQMVKAAFVEAGKREILMVCAAGNSSTNIDVYPVYPACFDLPNVISVANTYSLDMLFDESNYGPSRVHLAAPGSAIYSTYRSLSSNPIDSYEIMTGTSMAAPHVSGVAALLLSYNRNLSAAALKEAIMKTGDKLETLIGKTVTGKRLNARQALDYVMSGDNPPEPEFTISPSAYESITTTFNFNASGCKDVETSTSKLQVRWDWEPDGTWDTPFSYTKSASHKYTSPGPKSVRMEVRDTRYNTGSLLRHLTVSANLAYNRPANCLYPQNPDSQQSPPALAVDENEETFWRSANLLTFGNSQWLQVNFGANYKVSEVRIKFFDQEFPRQYYVEYWNGTTWKVIANRVISGYFDPDNWEIFPISGSVSTRYIRIRCVTPNTKNIWYAIRELQVY